MASVIKEAGKYKVYWCQTVQGVRHRSSKTFSTKKDAAAFVLAGDFKSHHQKPLYIIYNSQSPIVTEFLARFSRNTRNLYDYYLKVLFGQYGKPVDAVNYRDIVSYLDRQDWAPVTYNTAVGVFKSFYGWLEEEYGMFNAASKLKLKKALPSTNRFISIEDFRTFLSFGTKKFQQRALFLANTGLRVSEFLNLRWLESRINDENYGWPVPGTRLLHIVGKGRKQRFVPMNDTAWSILQSLPHDCEFVFSGKGRRVTRKSLTAQFADITEKSGVHCSPHKLRHLFATELSARGVSITLISRVLGHSSVGITDRVYTHSAGLGLESLAHVQSVG